MLIRVWDLNVTCFSHSGVIIPLDPGSEIDKWCYMIGKKSYDNKILWGGGLLLTEISFDCVINSHKHGLLWEVITVNL